MTPCITLRSPPLRVSAQAPKSGSRPQPPPPFLKRTFSKICRRANSGKAAKACPARARPATPRQSKTSPRCPALPTEALFFTAARENPAAAPLTTVKRPITLLTQAPALRRKVRRLPCLPPLPRTQLKKKPRPCLMKSLLLFSRTRASFP